MWTLCLFVDVASPFMWINAERGESINIACITVIIYGFSFTWDVFAYNYINISAVGDIVTPLSIMTCMGGTCMSQTCYESH